MHQTFTGIVCALLGFAAAGLAAPSTARAEAPQLQHAQAPGYFRMALGDMTVTALYDGYVGIDAGLLKGPKRVIDASLANAFSPPTLPLQTAVNAFLVQTRQNLILVDTGTANLFGPKLGFMAQNLQAAGYTPSQVDTVLLTHLHPDHAGGLLTPGGAMAFPNAHVFVTRADARYWLNETAAASAPQAQQALFKMARDAVAPYLAAGRLTVFDAGQPLRDGVSSVPAAGHTPGHTAYLFTSQGQHLLAWGDIVHSAAVQFAHPEVAIEYDSDQAQAIAARRALLALAAGRRYWVAGAHIPFPGLGHVHGDKHAAYDWVPADYGPLPDAPD
jgi:glyoxylase-like metal-dependent hydrolase (beta-lactamase superfamily II)